MTSYRDIVKKVLPAVVSIESQASKPRRPRRDEDMQLPPFGGADNDDGPRRIGFGSGFLVSAKGVVVTNFHVVDGADQVIVQLRDGRKFTSKDIKSDPKTDLAIVRISAKVPFPHLEMGDSDGMEIGDRVLAVGAPFGLTGSVTAGIISAKGRALRMNMYEDFLQTDAAINPGNSGGPLISLDGKVIGVDSAIKSRSGGFQGVGLAISSNLAQKIMQRLLKFGVVRRGYLGVQIRDVDDEETAKKFGMKDVPGVVVTRVFEGAPGAKGGLKRNDVILSVAGKKVRDSRELQTLVADLPLGKPTDVRILRDGKPRTLKITIEEQPRDFGSARGPTPKYPERGKGALALRKIGVDVADLTAELAEALGYEEGTKGAVITRVDPEGVAGEAGLRDGLLIIAVDRKRVANAKAARDAVAKGSLRKGIRLRLMGRTGAKAEVVLRSAPGE
jgi:serine protease Do